MNQKEQSFIDHLEELRRRLFVCVGAFFIAACASFLVSRKILGLLAFPLANEIEAVYFLAPYDAFLVRLRVAAFSGLILAMPILLFEAWRFIAPGLYPKEKRALVVVISASILLFFAGAFFALAGVAPFAIRFFLSYQTPELRPLLSITEYIAFITVFVVAFGLAFDLPVFLLGLIRLGVLNTRALSRSRPYIIVGLFVIAALLTPPDVLTQILLALPLWLLFEACLLVGRIIEKKC